MLRGAEQCLERFIGVQVELSIEPLYSGAPTLLELMAYLDVRGLVLMSVEPGFSEETSGRLLQFDGIFFRPDAVAPSP